MELVIRVDLDKAKQSLADVFNLIGNCRWTDEVQQDATAGAVVLNSDSGGLVVGEWNIEEAEGRPDPVESSYRAVASARYARPKQIEVDRFATVSLAGDGAYVQAWLYVPRADVACLGREPSMASSPKPPQSVIPMRKSATSAG